MTREILDARLTAGERCVTALLPGVTRAIPADIYTADGECGHGAHEVRAASAAWRASVSRESRRREMALPKLFCFGRGQCDASHRLTHQPWLEAVCPLAPASVA